MLYRLLLILLFSWPLPAHAACYDHCKALCQQNPGDLDLNTCTLRCTNACVEDNGNYSFTTPLPVPASTTRFGAIAISPATLESGHAFGFPSADIAGQEAQRHCRDDNKTHPEDCKTILTFPNTCASLAIKTRPTVPGGFWGTAFAPTEAEAAQKALESCKIMAGEACLTAYNFCSK